MANRSLEQQRALYALTTIEGHRQDDEADQRPYATLVRSLPTMVLQNGLGQALAFVLADTGATDRHRAKAASAFYREVQTWLHGPVTTEQPERVYRDEMDLITALMSGSRLDYRRAQETALALLGWMRKFADAYLPKGDR